VRTTDQGGLWYEKIFIILVNDVNETLKGDLNNDDQIDLADVLIALRVLAGLQPKVPVNLLADVNSDGEIGVEEAIYALRKVVVAVVPGDVAFISLTANPANVSPNGTSTITATVTDATGHLVADGWSINYTTTGGDLSAYTVTTVNGLATVTWTAPADEWLYTVKAFRDDISDEVIILVGPIPPQ